MNIAFPMTRRDFLAAAVTGTGLVSTIAATEPPAARPNLDKKALVAITLDLEMARNFPTWERTEWDYEKGNLNDETKRYAVEACRRIKASGGVAHFFVVGRVFEQGDISWLQGIIKEGHRVGNHTYDHVNIKATTPEDIQFRFRRCPWLIEGRKPSDVIRDNIRLTTQAMRTRLGSAPTGFRTPGGFQNGLHDRPEVQHMLQELGFSWVSSLYPNHPIGPPRQPPSAEVLRGIVAAQKAAQPFVYPRGLVEIPMSPISDIGAFRSGRWDLKSFLTAISLALAWCIENQAVFDFLGHPSCLYAVDPEFRAIELICAMVRKAGNSAALVDLDTIAQRVRAPRSPSTRS